MTYGGNNFIDFPHQGVSTRVTGVYTPLEGVCIKATSGGVDLSQGDLHPVTKQYNLVPANGRWCLAAGKVTVGLASHWPRVTDNSGITTYGLMALGREMSTPPILQ